MNELTCAFTGHRPSHFQFGYDETDNDCLRLKITLRSEILRMIDFGVTQFLSGMALGVDMWAAEIVLALRKIGHPVKLTCVLPCETQADKWREEYRERYFHILENADEVLYTNIKYTSICMYERNKYLVEHTDYLLAVYDGISKGGTAQTVRFAQKKGIPITIIHPNTLLVKSMIEPKTPPRSNLISFF
jgi:uncharacterized phage-like protein YoqJ